ncbi:redoxin domain-containing protein [Allosaccharopolyspora coralli]|uniref:Redoxin domain-containing protein n=1 Tax=Allosaccharopolyspora coralli TaxID=2665642 RepID=A0A5Q3Q6M1_9PSEU|nr:redoxin domain-containing protein [Allosaccharopolyspora coralli]
MSPKPSARRNHPSPARTPVRPAPVPDHSRRREVVVAVVVRVVVAVLGGLYAVYSASTPRRSADDGSATQGSAQYPFAVGNPGPGQKAPDFTLPSSNGGQASLADYRGKNVLLYFQEGLMCQPCWDQLTDLERNAGKLKAAGIDDVVSVTTDPIDLVARKNRDEGVTTPVLSDPDLSVSRAYETNKYGMMGDSRNGHSFILVGPDGTIRWRADYGGPPKYTMFLPTEAMLADLRAGAKP